MSERVPVLGDEPASLALRALLSIEWKVNGGGTYTCPGCGSWTFSCANHANPDCLVDAALTAAGYPDKGSREAASQVLRDEEWKKKQEEWRQKKLTEQRKALADVCIQGLTTATEKPDGP